MIQLSSYGLFLETFSKKLPTCLLDCIEICLAMDGGLKSLNCVWCEFLDQGFISILKFICNQPLN